ncbi:hypothetical protein TYRP_005549 [Tyrophagus putrescentiae]|nr:hypothetical protein TYRP_005549 [Tyrophagus putrescentiae]
MSSLKRQLPSDSSVWSSFGSLQTNQADIAHLSSSIRQTTTTTSSFSSSCRLTMAQDSIVLKKQKLNGSKVAEMTGGKGLSPLSSTTSTFPHNDSQELYGIDSQVHKISLDDNTEELLNETNLRLKTKLARWPAMSNLNLDVEVSDIQFMSSLAPLLEQVPSERKASVKDKICRILLGEMSPSTPNLKQWSSEEEKIPTIVITPSTAVLQTFMKDAQKLILEHPSEHFYTQSTPISMMRKVSPLSGHFPISNSLNWSHSELDF